MDITQQLQRGGYKAREAIPMYKPIRNSLPRWKNHKANIWLIIHQTWTLNMAQEPSKGGRDHKTHQVVHSSPRPNLTHHPRSSLGSVDLPINECPSHLDYEKQGRVRPT
jgi:hypothetical protein